MKLAIPNTYCWILFFFMYFHCFLNILAELIYYADREFYKDWWNCKDMGEYWRLWNLPVHNFMIRHIYNPLLKRNVPKSVASFLVFFISGLGHEYVASVGLGVRSIWAFMGLLIQFPVIII